MLHRSSIKIFLNFLFESQDMVQKTKFNFSPLYIRILDCSPIEQICEEPSKFICSILSSKVHPSLIHIKTKKETLMDIIGIYRCNYFKAR